MRIRFGFGFPDSLYSIGVELSVRADDRHALREALRDQETIEWVAMVKREARDIQHIVDGRVQNIELRPSDVDAQKRINRQSEREFAYAGLDRDLPKADEADINLSARIVDKVGSRLAEPWIAQDCP